MKHSAFAVKEKHMKSFPKPSNNSELYHILAVITQGTVFSRFLLDHSSIKYPVQNIFMLIY